MKVKVWVLSTCIPEPGEGPCMPTVCGTEQAAEAEADKELRDEWDTHPPEDDDGEPLPYPGDWRIAQEKLVEWLGPSWGTYEITGHEVQLPPEAFYAALIRSSRGRGWSTRTCRGPTRRREMADLDDRELATVLAALECWKRDAGGAHVVEQLLATGFEGVPLSGAEIDALCARLKVRPKVPILFRYKVLVQQYVEETAEVWVEAEGVDDAIEAAMTKVRDGEVAWGEGDDVADRAAYAVYDHEEQLVWERG
jgi:hypothetical protein